MGIDSPVEDLKNDILKHLTFHQMFVIETECDNTHAQHPKEVKKYYFKKVD